MPIEIRGIGKVSDRLRFQERSVLVASFSPVENGPEGQVAICIQIDEFSFELMDYFIKNNGFFI